MSNKGSAVPMIERIIGDIDQETFKLVDDALSRAEKEERNLVLKINSGGGSMYDALAIVGRIRSSPVGVTAQVYGCAFSGAALIFMSADRRLMSKYAWLMWHPISAKFKGNAFDVDAQLTQTMIEWAQWRKIASEFTGKDEDFFNVKNDRYISAEECLAMGVADEIF